MAVPNKLYNYNFNVLWYNNLYPQNKEYSLCMKLNTPIYFTICIYLSTDVLGILSRI
jgi:hypothetical protein